MKIRARARKLERAKNKRRLIKKIVPRYAVAANRAKKRVLPPSQRVPSTQERRTDEDDDDEESEIEEESLDERAPATNKRRRRDATNDDDSGVMRISKDTIKKLSSSSGHGAEDAEIAQLEKKLGIAPNYGTWGKIAKGLRADGFDDDFIDFLKQADAIVEGGESSAKARRLSVDDDEEEEEGHDTEYLPSDNLYGRNDDDEASSTSSSSSMEDDPAVRRKVFSLMNRLGEETLAEISREVTKLYDSFPKASVSSTVVQWMFETLERGGTTPILRACLAATIAYVDANSRDAGLGALAMERITVRLEEAFSRGGERWGGELGALLVQAVAMGINSRDILVDLSRRAAEAVKAGKVDIDALLNLLDEGGDAIRAVDPSAYRECLTALSLAPQFTGSKRLAEHLQNAPAVRKRHESNEERTRSVRKWLARERAAAMSSSSSSLPPPAPLAVRWEDYLQAKTKGRWWVLGGAWQQSATALGATSISKLNAPGRTLDATATVLRTASREALAAAARVGIANDVARAFFCVLLSSNDDVDAFARFLKLGLGGGRDREAVRAVLAAALGSRRYTPFYERLLSRLCNHDRGVRFTVQLALWDALKEEGRGAHEIEPLARVYAALVGDFSLSLASLKSLDWLRLGPREGRFLRRFLAWLLRGEGIPGKEGDLKVAKTFARGGGANAKVRDGLLVFLTRAFKPEEEEKGGEDFPPGMLMRRRSVALKILRHYESYEAGEGGNDHDDDDD